jgi:poly-gamma-glutamate synthesis protein (capsule biosynthesis protein)
VLIAFVLLDAYFAVALYATLNGDLRVTPEQNSPESVEALANERVLAQASGPAQSAFSGAASTSSTETETSLIAVGDIMLARAVGTRITRNGVDYPFAELRDLLTSADITFGNLETPIIEGAPVANDNLVFRSDVGVEKGLVAAGFDVLSLANNHTMNYGVRGLERTIDLLDAAGVEHVGAGTAESAHTATIVEHNGVRFAFLAYVDTAFTPDTYAATESTLGVAMMDITQMQKDVAAARTQADAVIVSMHAGEEYAAAPDTTQQEFAHAAIDAGVELVIGHHPHVIQPVEQYSGKYILYSLGNFVFDQGFSQETVEGLLATVHFAGAQVDHVEYTPVVIEDYAQPRQATPEEAINILERLGTKASGALLVDTEETYQLRDGRLTVYVNGAAAWASPEEWYVDQAAIGDVTGDGVQELTMSVWKSGNFGSSKPFWVNENDPSIKNHFFVFKFEGGTVQPLWQSSNLEKPNCDYLLANVDGDAVDELVVTEGEYAEGRTCEPNHYAVWKWNEWGFVNEWRSDAFSE